MSDFSTAFSEVKRDVQPDVDPKLTYGDGVTPNATKELDTIILSCLRVTLWASGLAVTYGQVIVPVTGNGRKYKVTTPGTLDTTEPVWPGEFGSVTSNDVTLVEDGYFVGSVYDVRRAKYEAWNLKASKATNDNQFLQDARGQASTYTYLNCQRERDKYKTVGVA